MTADGFLGYPRGSHPETFDSIRRIAPGAAASVIVRLRRGAVVRGRVTGPGGTPVAAAAVFVRSGP